MKSYLSLHNRLNQSQVKQQLFALRLESLTKLFGSANNGGPSSKRAFHPTAECVVASQQAKKKATNQTIKTKILSAVLLKEKPVIVSYPRVEHGQS